MRLGTKSLLVCTVGTAAMMVAVPAFAQVSGQDSEDVVVATGIRSSIQRAQDIKREAIGVVDAIAAEDLGKFPDLNVAESLQRISGLAIDRSGGEGQAVTIRGLGPQFNTVLMNGRQIATDSGGREFNFDVLAAEQITGATVYKSGRSNLQEGGIGGTINVTTARPFDNPGFQMAGTVKGVYESLSEKISPAGSLLISNTFNDDKFGLLGAVSYSERDVQINQIATAGWRPGQTISNVNDGVLFENAYIPRNWDQIVDRQKRKRLNASLAAQFAPNDDITVTLDGFISKFEVDSEVTDLASWFEPDRVGSGTIDANGTLTSFTQEIGLNQGSGDPASDFVSTTRNSRDVTNTGFGANIDWDATENLSVSLDAFHSTAENDRAGKDRFNVVGIINNYSFDGTGEYPTVQHDGFSGNSLPDANLSRLHYNEKGNVPTDEDQITEFKADFVYTPDVDAIKAVRFGAYNQMREKSRFQIFGNQCAFCGYQVAAPNDVISFRPFTAGNFFPGLIDTFYTYDGDAYVDYLSDQGVPIVTSLQNNRYEINEDIISAYTDVTVGFDAGNVPVEINMGMRYSDTDIDVTAVQSFIADVVPTTDLTLFSNVFGPATDITEGGSYSNFLGNVDVSFEVREDMKLRFAAYESLTRATMSELSPATNFGEPRRQNLTASGGNPALNPFKSTNFDAAYEWYYSDDSVFSVAAFHKDIDDIIVNLTGNESFTLANRSAADGFRCAGTTPSCAAPGDIDPSRSGFDVIANTEELNGESELYRVSRPQNGESATVTGIEVAITHVLDNGFGFSANATFVDSNVVLDPTSATNFSLEGVGDSQNAVLFYENEKLQARVAYNRREGFLRRIDNGFNGEPINTETFGQFDASASYDINEQYSIFVEGINITGEELRQTGRFENQIYSIEDNGSRYAIGVRGKW
ncbi:TonB-dependent receptor [Litorimonas cladophorae]|uniref:TonB-dependent receptor n=1 Tax=Litorimonas cladophorae TaxID=1220491 RepID=A0A918KRM9_9PROT|nr:TonB-dependent receptor [Litorimonas cladophorae]GGX70870.1 TonB-dependent receptor [Litorimonas cladophorae]